jgi:hypothetical protein
MLSVEGGVGERGGISVALVLFVTVPAGVAAAVGWIASRFSSAGDAGAR